MMTPADQFLSEIEAFLDRSKMKPTAFGKAVLKDPNFVRDLKDGRKPNLGVVERVQNYIRQHDATETAA